MPDFKAKLVPPHPNPGLRARLLEAMRTRQRPDEFIRFFHEDAVLHMVGDRRDCPFYGVYRGRAQILGLLRAVDAEFERQDHRILGAVIDGDSIALRRLVELRHRGSSQSAQLVIGHVARTRDGLIEEVFEFGDTERMRRLMGDP
jgi:hypothetical protein